MTLDELKATLGSSDPPAGLPLTVVALWHDARGDWDAAHEVAQRIPDPEGAWIHAYLHRKEGDASNAAYWYSRAGRAAATDSLAEEWERIATVMLAG